MVALSAEAPEPSSILGTDGAPRRATDSLLPPRPLDGAPMVHGERSVGLLYGQRALLIGALEPLTYTGTMLSTRAGDRPFKRLARTAKIQETVFLGTREEADKALAVVHRLHERIKGELPEAAGVHPAGTAYSAFDPELMLWTLAVIADSGRAMYETMVRPLSEGEREGLWQDYVRFGELFGLPAQRGPRQLPRVQRLVRGQARLPRPARDRARAGDGAAGRLRAAGAARRPAATSSPRTTSSRARCRRGCGRSSASAGAAPTSAAFRAMTAAHRRARRAFPRQMRRGRNDDFFDVVTQAEHQRGGTVTPQLHAGA